MINNDTIPVFDPKKPFKAVDSVPEFDPNKPFEEKKNSFQNVAPTGTQTSKRGFEPFLPQVPTKTPSVLTPKGQVGYQEQVKDYVPPKAVQQPKEEKPDFFESVKNSLSNVGTGLQQFVPNTTIALSETLQGLLGKDLGSDFYRNIVGSANNPEIDRYEAYAKLAELEPQFKRTRGLIESAENFDAVGLAAATIDAMSSLVRTAITSVPTYGIGLASDMVGGSIASYNQEKAKSKGISVDELYKRGENEFAIPATIGAIGTGLEGIGLKGTIGLINKKLTGSFAKKFATTFVDVNKEGLTEFLQTGLDASNKALSQGKSITDASKVAVDEMFSKKGLESYLMGVVGSAGSAGVGRVVKGMLPTNKKKATEATQRISEMESELSNPNISPATQEFIAENIRQNVSEVADAIENDANEVEGLSDDQKFTINSINEVIGSYEQVLEDPNASEQTKKLAQERISGLDLEVDNILEGKKLSPETQALVESKVPPLEKPTIDTEEQIIAEGQQAEADFQATDDLVTYEQKMKELDDRANNLVPAPEDAEIGKPEEVVEVEPIRQLGTGANVYFETEKYRVNDGLKNGNVLLNIQSKTSEAPIANIEFDNANDAVIIAQELNDKFPDGVPDAILIDKYIEQLKNDLLKPQTDAIQVEAAGQVPVLTEASVGEEVEQGKPQPKAKVVTEEGKEEVGGDVDVSGNKILSSNEWNSLSEDEQNKIKGTITDKVTDKNGNTFSVDYNLAKPIQKIIDAGYSTGQSDSGTISDHPNYRYIEDSSIGKYKKGDVIESGSGAYLTFWKPEATEIEETGRKTNTQEQIDKIRQAAVDAGFVVEDGEVFFQPSIIIRLPFNDTGISRAEILSEANKLTNKKYPDLKEKDFFSWLDKRNGEFVPMVEKEAGGAKKWTDKDVIAKWNDLAKNLSEQTPAQEVEQLRAEEQAELKAAIPNADQYLTNGKVDRAKIKNAKDINKFDEIYDKYDKLITPLLPKSETKAGSVGVGDGLDYVRNKFSESESGGKQLSDKESKILNKEVDRLIERAEKENGVKRNELKQATWKTNDGYTITEFFENGSGGTRIITPKGEEINLFDNKYKSQSGQKISYFPKAHKAVEQSLKETPKAEPTPAKPKTEPRLKPRVETRIKFTKAIELFNDISATKGGAKKRTLSSKRRTFLEQNPSIKYIDDNWKSISKQLEDKGLLKKEGNCP